jgi:Fic-DOC domain mobile mystery protein B
MEVEGATPLDPDEAADLIPRLTTQRELNDFELKNITKAMAWALTSRKASKEILTVQLLRLLHRKMFDQTWKWAGRFRTTQKSIGVESWRISSELHNLVEDAKLWIATAAYDEKEIAARFHHRLVSIHPFPNGNGRHARLATDVLCISQKWPEPSWGRSTVVSSETARQNYLAALRAADAYNFGPLLDFMWS